MVFSAGGEFQVTPLVGGDLIASKPSITKTGESWKTTTHKARAGHGEDVLWFCGRHVHFDGVPDIVVARQAVGTVVFGPASFAVYFFAFAVHLAAAFARFTENGYEFVNGKRPRIQLYTPRNSSKRWKDKLEI